MKVGVNVAIIHNDQILLTKRKDFRVWCLPGGHVDIGESVSGGTLKAQEDEVLEMGAALFGYSMCRPIQ